MKNETYSTIFATFPKIQQRWTWKVKLETRPFPWICDESRKHTPPLDFHDFVIHYMCTVEREWVGGDGTWIIVLLDLAYFHRIILRSTPSIHPCKVPCSMFHATATTVLLYAGCMLSFPILFVFVFRIRIFLWNL